MTTTTRIYLSGCLCISILLGIPAVSGAASRKQCDETAHVCMVAQNDGPQADANLNVPGQASRIRHNDLSEAGEAEYVQKMKQWLATLPEQKQAIATDILTDAHDEMHKLRKAIYSKKLELAAVRFDNQESLAALPKLGMDLQKLRATLRAKLEYINGRLMREAGIQMNELAGEGLWLQPLAKTPDPKGAIKPMDNYGVPISMTADYYLPVDMRY